MSSDPHGPSRPSGPIPAEPTLTRSGRFQARLTLALTALATYFAAAGLALAVSSTDGKGVLLFVVGMLFALPGLLLGLPAAWFAARSALAGRSRWALAGWLALLHAWTLVFSLEFGTTFVTVLVVGLAIAVGAWLLPRLALGVPGSTVGTQA